MIKLENVSKTFNSKERKIDAVKNVSLTVNDSEIFGIVGFSGAGKSTLIRLINGLEKSDTGIIEVNGDDITKLSEKDLRQKRRSIGMIFQNFNLLWSRTVLENIMFPLETAHYAKEERYALASKMAERVGLKDKLNEYPSALSGGQKQRVGIARALVLKPQILLCDEATSALDPKTTEDILNLLKDLNKELSLTILMITHQMEVVQKICHRLAVMKDGEVVESGTVKDIFANPQNPITRELIHKADSLSDVHALNTALKEKYPQGDLLRIVFDNQNSEKPILSEITQKTAIPINIVSANIQSTQEGAVGVMYVHSDSSSDSQRLIAALKEYDVHAEVI